MKRYVPILAHNHKEVGDFLAAHHVSYSVTGTTYRIPGVGIASRGDELFVRDGKMYIRNLGDK